MSRTKGSKNKRTLIRERQLERLRKRAELGQTIYTGEGSNRSKLDRSQQLAIIECHEQGMKQEDLAELFKVDQSTISRILMSFVDTTKIAKMRLRASALTMAELAIRGAEVAAAGGNADPALELLDRTDVAPRRLQNPSGGTGTQVMVVVGGQATNALPEALRPVKAIDAVTTSSS